MRVVYFLKSAVFIAFTACLVVAEEKPTLDETTGWLAARLPEATKGVLFERGVSDKLFQERLSFNGCKMQLESLQKLAWEEKQATLIIDLSKVTSPVIERFLGSSKLTLRSLPLARHAFTFSGSIRSISLENSIESMGPKSPLEYQYSPFTIRLLDTEMAERVYKALKHAVKLCGGAKKESF